MNRLTLTVVLLLPLVIVAGLGVMAFGEASKRRGMEKARIEARLAAAEEAARKSAKRASFISEDSTEAASREAASAGERLASDGAADGEQPKLVRPESLPQGFVLVVKDLTGLATADSPIYLASNHNGWDPGDAKMKLTPRSDLRWQIVITKLKNDAPLDFKFTRGNWDRVELATDLSEISNRALPQIDASKLGPNEQPVLEFEVPRWGDQRPSAGARPDLDPYYKLDVVGTARRIQVPGGGVPANRDVIVWLPPGYDDPANAARTYPVLYLQDGQNLFQKMPVIPAEWGVDEAATALIKAGKIEPLIVVGIPHSQKGRLTEYLPFDAIDGVKPRGEEYVDFLVNGVMPRVERQFRVKKGPENTGVGGSSLGALIALHAATRHPDKFGKVLCESMSFVAAGGGSGEGRAQAFFSKQNRWPSRIYFGMGGRELGGDPGKATQNAAYVAGIKTFSESVAGKHLKADQIKLVIDADSEHNETAWAARLPGALEFLFPAK